MKSIDTKSKLLSNTTSAVTPMNRGGFYKNINRNCNSIIFNNISKLQQGRNQVNLNPWLKNNDSPQQLITESTSRLGPLITDMSLEAP